MLENMTELSNRAVADCGSPRQPRNGDQSGSLRYERSPIERLTSYLQWPDGRVGALEVTLIVEAESIAWQGLASKEGWRWPAAWGFRANRVNFPYKQTRRIALRAVELCDLWSVYGPAELPAEVLADEQWLIQY